MWSPITKILVWICEGIPELLSIASKRWSNEEIHDRCIHVRQPITIECDFEGILSFSVNKTKVTGDFIWIYLMWKAWKRFIC